MRTVAIYNMKGGVGKTTTAVNLSYLAASAGQRALLWDLDPQAATSFTFRVRPRVEGFGRKSLEGGQALSAAIKATDYDNLDLLPADFAYRKFDRLLDDAGKPERVVRGLLDTLGREYDVVFLDCPAGFSLVTEGVFAAADAVLVPTIPTVLSLRTVARLIKWADGCDSPVELAAFFSMVDRRKTLHRRACEWSADHSDTFMAGQIPYSSVVEQMTVRRMPLGAFAPRDAATAAFAEIWSDLQRRLPPRGETRPRSRHRWLSRLQAIESLIVRLESENGQQRAASHQDDACLLHSFDTEGRDLQRSGNVLELRERNGRFVVVVARSDSDDGADVTRRAQVQVDTSWALNILSGAMSPLAAIDQRLGRPAPGVVDNVRAIVGKRKLQRIDSRQRWRLPSNGVAVSSGA
jgi:chromosome partitioning protein